MIDFKADPAERALTKRKSTIRAWCLIRERLSVLKSRSIVHLNLKSFFVYRYLEIFAGKKHVTALVLFIKHLQFEFV